MLDSARLLFLATLLAVGLGVTPARVSAAQGAPQDIPVFVDDGGVLRWTVSGSEVALFGVNYSTPFAHAYRAHGRLGVDHKEAIDADVLHLARLGLDAYRIHVWDREVSDREGNLLENEHVDLLDYLMARLAEYDIKVMLTPIAWWPSGYPEPDPGTEGLSDGFSKIEMSLDLTVRGAQVNYLQQFITHLNPYTGYTYGEDPNLIAIEIFNEPAHSDDQSETTGYINTLVSALRETGFDKPIFYNISQDYRDPHGMAVCAADIQGVSHQWYPTGLVRNEAVGGNMLLNVERYNIPYEDFSDCRNKARMVYEFDAADVAGSYMYPAMARSFRRAGFQWATQFAYDPVFMAYANTEYQTHFLNLVYTPGKAISYMIAGEVFRKVQRGADHGIHPVSDRFQSFRVSYEEDLSEMVEDTVFFYSNDTSTEPASPGELRHVAGVGTSAVAAYDGTGAYFIDRVDDGIWRLEVYPDVVWVADPFTRSSLSRTAARVLWNDRMMGLSLPDLGRDFSVEPLNEGNTYIPDVQGNSFRIRPGIFLLRRSGTPNDDWNGESVVDGKRLGAFFAPPPTGGPTVVLHVPPDEIEVGEDFVVSIDVVSDSPVDSVVLFRTYAGGFHRMSHTAMTSSGGFSYQVALPEDELTQGLLEYVVSVYDENGVVTFPETVGGTPRDWDFTGRTFWRVPVVGEDDPILLFDAKRDLNHLLYPHQWQYVRFTTNVVPGSEPGRMAIAASVDNFNPAPHHFALRSFLPRGQRVRLHGDFAGAVLVVRARSFVQVQGRMEVALVEKDGNAWGTVLELTDEWLDYSIPVADFSAIPLALLPRPYPQFLPYLRQTDGSGVPDVSKLDGIQFSMGAHIFPDDEGDKPHGFEVERVVLIQSVASR